tara:strand:+ start:402 stop:758 length:357 start_codon:yes stop_codon:yes gene_type:complete
MNEDREITAVEDSIQERPSEKSLNTELPKKGPMSFLSGSLTSLVLAWTFLLVSQKTIVYFTIHSPNYISPIAQSAASGFKTLVIGTSFLATFSFAFIGLGLLIVFFKSLFIGRSGSEG